MSFKKHRRCIIECLFRAKPSAVNLSAWNLSNWNNLRSITGKTLFELSSITVHKYFVNVISKMERWKIECKRYIPINLETTLCFLIIYQKRKINYRSERQCY